MTPRWASWWAVLVLSLAGLACGLRQGLRIADGDLDFAFEPDVEAEHKTGGGDPHRAAHAQGQGRRGAPTAKLTQRQWGVQDTTATAGKLFRFAIPGDAFSGDVDHYEAQSPNGSPLPSWLLFDQTTGLFEGVPTLKDVGTVYVTVHAVSAFNSAKDKFSIDVLPPAEAAPSAGVVPLGLTTHHHPKVKCGPGEDPLILSVVMDGKYDHMKPRQRLTTIDNLSGFLSLSHDLFQLLPQNSREDILSEDSIVMAGEGNVQKRKWKQGSVIQWQVGCESQLWPQQTRVVEDLKQQARDGTLAEVLLWPVVGWHIKADNSLANRGRREAAGQNEAGSGNFAEDGATDDTEAGEGGVPDSHIVPTMSSPVYPGATATPTPFSHNFNSITENPSQHHHRHHHGDLEPGVLPGIQEVDNPVEEFRSSRPDSGPLAPYLSSSFGGGGYSLPSSPVLYGSIMPTPTLEPERPTIHFGIGSPTPEITRVYEGLEVTPTPVFPTDVEPTTYPSPSSAGSPSYSPSSGTGNMDQSSTHVTEPMIDGTSGSSTSSSPASGTDVSIEGVETRESTEKPVTIVDVSDFYDPTNITSTSHPSTVPSTAGTTPPTTTPAPVTTTTTPPTTTTEIIEIDQKNFPPTVNMRLRKQPVTAGKIVKYVVPDETFKDLEEGSTRNLRLTLKTKDGNDLDQTSWIQFNSARREILLLPLEEHVSRWFFSLEATDKEGASVSDKLEVVVQHHQHRRAVNHEITLVMEPTALIRQEKVLNWEVVLVETLARLFGDPDTSQITVRHLDVAQLSTNGSVSLTYTNDSLPRATCPHEGIQNMLKVLRRNEDGDPSQALFHALTVHAKHLNIRKVLYKGLANCEEPTKPEVQPGSPISNYPPVPRNQVDHINATVGMLLSYKVPEDSFYDPEDGDTRAMKLSLLTMDHSLIPPDNWLQFDIKNQEFYGVPMPSDEGSKEYQLVCEDRGGLRAHDGLVVVVHRAKVVPYSVEFSITINPHYETFIRNTPQKRKFVEKLRELFGDPDTSNIVIGRISKFLHESPLIGEVSKHPNQDFPSLNIKGSTVITWYNSTLPTTRCPHDEISTLRRVLVNDDNQMSSRLISVMGPEFTVLAVGLYPTAVCQGELTPLHPTYPPPPPVDEVPPMGSSEEYLITFVVPAVIICTMLLLAGIVACVLYRRRRTGKMSVGDEDERQSFRNKGIPVIFQDELEEQTEPINKSPVIMKEEKPPLPPPEYQRHNPSPPPTQALLSDTEDAEPYQPPPPFTTSRDTARHTRHKSTPTYRKPPPYVPP
ncbi:dystroglycan 1 [Frankliniella occidentalis]|uniref:Dystroglycan 1 n=1 Tax=Frankliniella occidentalis TaxID=133901 RepID=A0A9C6UA88_FRAOC|nr:dystroglycan 1 [Frankliniella occidentalis]